MGEFGKTFQGVNLEDTQPTSAASLLRNRNVLTYLPALVSNKAIPLIRRWCLTVHTSYDLMYECGYW